MEYVLFAWARDHRTWLLYWLSLILRNINENQLLWDFQYLIIYFIYTALYFIVISCSTVFIIKLAYIFPMKTLHCSRENIFENTCCYIRACLWELRGICADLLNHPLESNNPYFLSASITWRYALKRDCNQEENISEPTENTWKWKKKNQITAVWEQYSVDNKLALECCTFDLYNIMVKMQCAAFSGLQHSSMKVWCQLGSNFHKCGLVFILFVSKVAM